MRLAALPMYDLPEVAEATDAFWSALARRLRAGGVQNVPDRLQRGVDPRQLWRSPDLLFAQTCGFPLMHEFAGRLALIATPRYAVGACEGPTYRSRIVVRSDDPREKFQDFAGAVVAINSEDSHSGFNILRWRVAQEKRSGFLRKGRAHRRAFREPRRPAVRQSRPGRDRLRDLRAAGTTPAARARRHTGAGGHAHGAGAALCHGAARER